MESLLEGKEEPVITHALDHPNALGDLYPILSLYLLLNNKPILRLS